MLLLLILLPPLIGLWVAPAVVLRARSWLPGDYQRSDRPSELPSLGVDVMLGNAVWML